MVLYKLLKVPGIVESADQSKLHFQFPAHWAESSGEAEGEAAATAIAATCN